MQKITISGSVTCSRLIEILQLKDPSSCRGRLTWLIDMSQARLETTPAELRQLRDHLRWYRNASGCDASTCCAAVVVQDNFTFGMLRMFQAYTERSHLLLHVVRQREAATRWLEEVAVQ